MRIIGHRDLDLGTFRFTALFYCTHRLAFQPVAVAVPASHVYVRRAECAFSLYQKLRREDDRSLQTVTARGRSVFDKCAECID